MAEYGIRSGGTPLCPIMHIPRLAGCDLFTKRPRIAGAGNRRSDAQQHCPGIYWMNESLGLHISTVTTETFLDNWLL